MGHPFRIAAVLVLACSSVAGAATLIHQYDFNTDGVVTDAVGGQNGVLYGDASVSGGRLNLDGSGDFVEFASHLVPTSGQYSVTLSGRQLSLQGGITEMISQGSSGGPGFYIGHDYTHNFRVTDSWLSSGIPFPSDGELHHYALVVDSASSILYVDGSPVGSTAAIATTTGGSNTRLGRQFGSYDEYFHGQLDDVRIYSGALTAGEVAAIAVPEPSALSLLGLVALAGLRRMRA